MIEEIIFRGMGKNGEGWLEGYLFKVWEKAYIIWGTSNGMPNMDEVIPETVGQYIGLRDANNKKLFTGDIICTRKFGTPEVRYTIEYDAEIAAFIGTHKKGCVKHFTTFAGDSDAFELVGGIWDK